MKAILILTILIISLTYVYAGNNEKIVTIKAKKEVNISNRKFYIYQVNDNRPDSFKNIGFIKGVAGLKTYLNLEDSLKIIVKNYLNIILPKKDSMIAIKMKINKISSKNKQTFSFVAAIVYMEIEFFSMDNKLLFNINLTKERQKMWITPKTYADLIQLILIDSLTRLNEKLSDKHY